MNHAENYEGRDIIIREKPVASAGMPRTTKPTHTAHDVLVNGKNVSRQVKHLSSTGEKILADVKKLIDDGKL